MTTADRAPDFSIVVPTLNEVDNVDPLLEQIFALGQDAGSFEVVIVDDASTDGTDARVRAWAETHPVRLVERRGARGLASAVIAGARAARSDVVVVMDADLSHPVSAIPSLARALLEQRADVAIGSRRVSGGGTPGWPLRRRLASRFASALAWPISSARDPLAGYFATRRAALLALGDAPEGFKILLEVLAAGGSGLCVVEVPIVFVDRTRGQSKLGLGTAREYLRRLAVFCGGELGTPRVRRLRGALAASALADALVYALLAGAGASLGLAQLAGAAVALAAALALRARDLFASSAAPRAPVPPWARLAGVALLAAFLRGGVLESFVRAGFPPLVAFAPALVVGVGLLWLAASWGVFPPARERERALGLRLGCLALAAYLFALRAAYLGAIELLPEEAYYWSYSQHLALSYLDHPPLIAWLIAGSTALLGQNEWAVRLPALLCAAVTAGFAFALAEHWLGKTAAAAALALCAALPFTFTSGAMMTPDAPLAAAWSGALYFLYRALVEERPRAWLGAGICIGLGLLAKYTIALLGLGALAFALLDSRARAQLRRPEPWLGAALALVLFSPVILWNRHNEWASFAFQSTRRLSAAFRPGLHHLVAGVAVLLGPVALALAALAGPRARQAIGAERRRFGFAACAALAPLAVVFAFTLAHPPKLNWTGPFWLALFAPAGALLAAPAAAQTSRLGRVAARSFVPALLLALVGYGGLLHALGLGIPGADFPAGTRYAQRWREIAQAVDRAADELIERDGAPPLVVAFDRYGAPSLLAFYQPQDDDEDRAWDVAGRHLFGLGTSLMYDRWLPPDAVAGRTLLCVSEEPRDLELAARFASAPGPVESVPITAGRKGHETLYLRALRGYDPALVSGTKRKKAAASNTAVSGASSSHIEPSSRMPSAARASSPSSSGLAGFALARDSSSTGTHSGR